MCHCAAWPSVEPKRKGIMALVSFPGEREPEPRLARPSLFERDLATLRAMSRVFS